MITPRTPVFLTWLADRLVNIYDESENVDFVQRLRREARRAQTLRTSLSANENTYQLFMTDDPPTVSSGKNTYELHQRGGSGVIASKLYLTAQEAGDLARQLDASVDYFND
jgi:hypothetical protein